VSILKARTKAPDVLYPRVPAIASRPVSPKLPAGRAWLQRRLLLRARTRMSQFECVHGRTAAIDTTMEQPAVAVVEDDAGMRAALESWLRSAGFVPRTFASAEAFLQSAHLTATAFVVSDIALPGMSGLELQRELARRGLEIPIAFVTAQTSNFNAMRAQAVSAGAIAFLQKPFDGDELLTALRCVTRQQRKPT
jgi:CheY-like chemotaxis protein